MRNKLLLMAIVLAIMSCSVNRGGNVLEPRRMLTLKERVGNYEEIPFFLDIEHSKMEAEIYEVSDSVHMKVSYYASKNDDAPLYEKTYMLGALESKETKFSEKFSNDDYITIEFVHYVYSDIRRLEITMYENGGKITHTLKQVN